MSEQTRRLCKLTGVPVVCAHSLRGVASDADAAGVHTGDIGRVVSATGAVELEIVVTDEVGPGTIAIPQGWGHRGGGSWRLANANPGINVNELTSSRPEDLEALAGMSVLNGVAVRLEAVT